MVKIFSDSFIPSTSVEMNFFRLVLSKMGDTYRYARFVEDLWKTWPTLCNSFLPESRAWLRFSRISHRAIHNHVHSHWLQLQVVPEMNIIINQLGIVFSRKKSTWKSRANRLISISCLSILKKSGKQTAIGSRSKTNRNSK